MNEISLCDGKYTVVYDDYPNNFQLKALRYGEFWIDFTGDNLILALVQKIIEQQETIDSYELQRELDYESSLGEDI
jgi:hypothetical protein